MLVLVCAALARTQHPGSPSNGASPPATQEASAPANEAAPWRAERAAVLSQSIATLEKLADWCTANEAFAERDKLFELVLRIDPEHFRAHKALKHVQTRDGKWLPPEKTTPSRNFNPAAAARFPTRMREELAPCCAALLALVDRHDLDGLDRELLFDDVVRFDPEHPRVRGERGETKLGDVWVLEETVRAKERRPQLKATVKRALADAAEPHEFRAEEHDPDCGLEWKCLLGNESVRVFSMGERDEAALFARYATATLTTVDALLGTPDLARQPFSLYALKLATERSTFLANHPQIEPAQRPALANAVTVGLNVRGDFMTCAQNAEERLDTVVRQTIAHVLTVDYGVLPQTAWAFEGIGMYLTRELTGTRMTYFSLPASANAAQVKLRKQLVSPKANWMNEAHEMLESERKPDLAALLRKNVDELTIEDLLYSYVLAAYLLEARAVETPRILRSIGDGMSSENALRDVLGIEIAVLDARVRRWLSERR
ncbi:MAG: hypothetical protein L6Q99_13155 [Planctomycetes bacterium]|nr:hypothetical protein [Planctomycetota bacterium]